MRQKFDYSKLRKLIREKYGNTDKLAQIVDIPAVSLAEKLSGAADFTQSEIDGIRAALGIGEREITELFFRVK